jgi:hypothetical protein
VQACVRNLGTAQKRFAQRSLIVGRCAIQYRFDRLHQPVGIAGRDVLQYVERCTRCGLACTVNVCGYRLVFDGARRQTRRDIAEADKALSAP